METSHIPVSFKLNPKIISYFTAVCGLILFVASLSQVGVNWWQKVAIFALLSFMSQLAPPRLPQGYEFSLAFVLDLIVIVLYGPPVAIVTRLTVTLSAGLFIRLFGNREPLHNVFKTSFEAVLAVGIAGVVYQTAGGSIWGFAAASVVYFFVNTCLVIVHGLTTNKEHFTTSWFSVVRALYIYFLVLSPLAYFLTNIIRTASVQWKIFSVMIFFVPVLLVSHAFRLFLNIQQSYLNTVKTMVRAIEAKDSYTKGHSEHVAEITLAIARDMGIPERELQKLEYVTLLHDAGKMGVSEKILNKPGTLSKEEYEQIKKHSAIGAEIIRKINFLASKADIVLHHHEKYDGTGYPDGLSGNDIPLASRILALADAYNAMITNRPFRPAKTPQQAVKEIQELAGKQFDPYLVVILKNVLERRGEL